jgi:hypothetical protein
VAAEALFWAAYAFDIERPGAVGAFQVVGRLACTALQPWLPAQRKAILLFVAQAVALPPRCSPPATHRRPPAQSSRWSCSSASATGCPTCCAAPCSWTTTGRATTPTSMGSSPSSWSPRVPPALLAGLGVTAFGGHSATLVGAAALMVIGAYAQHRAHRAFTTEPPPAEPDVQLATSLRSVLALGACRTLSASSASRAGRQECRSPHPTVVHFPVVSLGTWVSGSGWAGTSTSVNHPPHERTVLRCNCNVTSPQSNDLCV